MRSGAGLGGGGGNGDGGVQGGREDGWVGDHLGGQLAGATPCDAVPAVDKSTREMKVTAWCPAAWMIQSLAPPAPALLVVFVRERAAPSTSLSQTAGSLRPLSACTSSQRSPSLGP